MDHKLSVLVRAYVESRTVRLVTTGCLTEASQQALQPLVRRASGLGPDVRVLVDLTGARHVEATGIDRLRAALELDNLGDPQEPVELLLPDFLPACPLGSNALAMGSR